MENKNRIERTLGYKTACLIKRDELAEVSGGGSDNIKSLTTKETVDNRGNWDVGLDAIW